MRSPLPNIKAPRKLTGRQPVTDGLASRQRHSQRPQRGRSSRVRNSLLVPSGIQLAVRNRHRAALGTRKMTKHDDLDDRHGEFLRFGRHLPWHDDRQS